MSEPFLRVLFPGQAHVCGRKLPPLTLWRLACLHAIQSPFLQGGDEDGGFTLANLLHALRAVSTPNLTPPDLRPRPRDVFTLIRRRHSAVYREKHGAVFMQWLAVHQIRPELWQNEEQGEGRSISAPLILSLVAGLMDAGFSHTEAWDTSPGYASWLLAAGAERVSEGIKFANEEDEEINRLTAELDQRSEAEILAQARADLPPAVFERWVAARSQNPLKDS